MVVTRREIFIKTAYYFALLLALAGLETAIFPLFFPLRQTPVLLPFLTAAIAVYDGEAPGLLAGVAAGFFMDGLAGVFPFYTLCLLAAGGIIGAASPGVFRKRVLPAMLWGGLLVFVCELLRFIGFVYLPGQGGGGDVFTVILPRTVFSFLLSPLWVWPVLWIRRFFRKEQRHYR